MTQETSGRRSTALVLLFLFTFVVGFHMGAQSCSQASTGDLTVSVVDEDEKKVQNAIVTLDGNETGQTSASDGNYTFTDVEYGNHTVNVTKDGYQENSTQVNVQNESQSVTIVLSQSDGENGQVSDKVC